MPKQSERRKEAKVLASKFSTESVDMAKLDQERIELQQLLAAAVIERRKEERERTMAKPHKQRTTEEKRHAQRIGEAQENLDSK